MEKCQSKNLISQYQKQQKSIKNHNPERLFLNVEVKEFVAKSMKMLQNKSLKFNSTCWVAKLLTRGRS